MAWHDGLTREERMKKIDRATARAKRVLKPGDRVAARRCPGTVRTFTFMGWDGYWAVSKTGIDDIAASSITKVNGRPVNFIEETS